MPPSPPAALLPRTIQVEDWGDVSYLLEPQYSDMLRAALAAAEPWSVRAGPHPPLLGHTYLAAYASEEDKRLALRLKVWPAPRGHHLHVASVPFK